MKRMMAFVQFALFAAILAPLAAESGVSYGEAVSKPRESGYPGGVNISTPPAKIPGTNGKDVAKSFGAVAKDFGVDVLKEEGAEFAQALTTTAVYDGTRNVDLALRYGGNAAAIWRTAFSGKSLWDTGSIVYGLGGCVADVMQLGVEKGLMAARNRLYEIPAARPYVIIGEWLGEEIASLVYRGNKMIAKNNKSQMSATPISKTTAVNKPAGNSNTMRSKICHCYPKPPKRFVGVCKGMLNKCWARYYCPECGGFINATMIDFIKNENGPGYFAYPGGAIPSDWDGSIISVAEADELAKKKFSLKE